ncbi:hypothetical protein SDC9_96873 [bioreactor metagenome]|uniref:Uncharacterized protein n=1 Tax=bioreactor metagenome TaxID=1076179 RepID=A0A645ABR3_9ZZZZ
MNGIFGSGNYKMLPGVVFSYWIVSASDTLEDLNDDFAADLLGPPDGVLAATDSNGEVSVKLL